MRKMIENKKTSIILILKVLEEFSDENHYLTQQNIIDKVDALYGIELERKSVANSLMLLEELGYDINKGPRGGFALLSRNLEKSEVTFLVDAIFSSKSISGKQAKELTEKVSSGLSKYDRKSYEYLNKSSEVSRTTNKEVFLTIDLINDAIKRNKWVGFKYVDYDENGQETLRFDGYEYHRSPCYLVNNFGRYYFLGYGYKHDGVSAYRLDYMKDVYIMEDRERLDPKTLKEFKKYNSFTDYMNDHIYLFDGDTIEVKMKLNNPSIVKYLYDWFGKNARIYKENDELMATVKCNETAFFYWAMQYGQHLHIISPQSMVDLITLAASEILKQYNS